MLLRPRDVREADLMVVNARVITLDPACPIAEAVVVRGGRILAVGTRAETKALAGPAAETVDAGGGLVVPAFHDAHLHLLSYARSRSKVDCREVRSIDDLRGKLAYVARWLPAGTWIRAFGYDEARLAHGRHPDRRDLDAAAPDHPIRLQHRSLHLDVLNTSALRLAGLLDAPSVVAERDAATGMPTGRLYNAGELLRRHLDRVTAGEIARDVHLASQQLLSWGVTSVQDASVTNDAETWELFHRLSVQGDLGVRLFMLAGSSHWRELNAATPQIPTVRRGPVKIVLDEATSDPEAVCAEVTAIRRAGHAVAIHAVSEAEVAIALHAIQSAPADPTAMPNRIEHGAVIPEAWLRDLAAARVTVIGTPALVHERGDVYQVEYAPELHGWLHRARSLLAAGVPYAIGSDAPVTDPAPGLGLFAVNRRLTRSGSLLGPDEALGPTESLVALTLGPAQAVGVEGELGQIRPGALADLAVVDKDFLDAASIDTAQWPARLTIGAGRVVWRRPGA